MTEAAPPATTAVYLARVMIGQRGYRPGTVPEAAALADAADLVLTKADGMQLQILCIVDREQDPARTFPLDLATIISTAKQCLHYTGTFNGTKLPVGVQIWEVGPNAGAAPEVARLRPLARTWPGRDKVLVSAWTLDTTSHTVTSNARWGGRLAGRGALEKLLREPRRPDHELTPPAPAALSAATRPALTYAMLAALALAFAGEHVFAVAPWTGDLAPDVLTLAALGGLHHPLVAAGEWYRLLTASVLHAGVFHLLLNGVALLLGGVVLERLFGRAWLLALFVLGALGGSALSYLLNPPEIVSVGASGAIMGLLSAAFVSAWRLPEGPERTQIQTQVVQVLVPSLLPLAMTFGGKIDYASHLGGAIAGALVGLFLLRTWPRTDPLPRFRPVALAIAAGGLLTLAWGAVRIAGTLPEYAAAATARQYLEHLIPDAELPRDDPDMFARAEDLATRYPRDPRARLANAYRLATTDQLAAAETEVRAGLAEPDIATAISPERALEIELRLLLAKLLLHQNRPAEATTAATPVCTLGRDLPDPLSTLCNPP